MIVDFNKFYILQFYDHADRYQKNYFGPSDMLKWDLTNCFNRFYLIFYYNLYVC